MVWHITYRLSYRDLVAMMAEREVSVSHTTIHRWVIRYVPEFEKRWNRFARPVNNSWRVDETYIKVQGKWNYLYRAVDKHGETVDFLLRPDRSVAAAQAFFRKALSRCLPRRAIKRRCASMGGFKSFRSAAITLAGIELTHRIRKRQFALGRGRYRNFGSLKQLWERALA
jgi:transposase-like protein